MLIVAIAGKEQEKAFLLPESSVPTSLPCACFQWWKESPTVLSVSEQVRGNVILSILTPLFFPPQLLVVFILYPGPSFQYDFFFFFLNGRSQGYIFFFSVWEFKAKQNNKKVTQSYQCFTVQLTKPLPLSTVFWFTRSGGSFAVRDTLLLNTLTLDKFSRIVFSFVSVG